MTGRKYQLRYLVSRLKVVRRGVVKVVHERLQSVFVGWRTYFGSELRKLQQNWSFWSLKSTSNLQLQFKSRKKSLYLIGSNAFSGGHLVKRHGRKVVDSAPDYELNAIVNGERLGRLEKLKLIADVDFELAVVEDCFEEVSVGVVLGVFHIEFVSGGYSCAYYLPERDKVGRAAEDKVKKIHSIDFGLFFLLLT